MNDFLMMCKDPRIPGAPHRVWRDWVLVAALTVSAIVELVVRDDVVWPVFSALWAAALVATLMWRRTHPLAMIVVGFGSVIVSNIAMAVAGVTNVGLYSMAGLLILAYAVNRWGSGREATIALGIMVAAWATSVLADYTGVGDTIGGLVVLLFPAELGAVVRYNTNVRQQQIEQAKSITRQQLARELHDTVAHHVSAIAIQAQGGRAMAASNPRAAVDVLATIEEEASRALEEMRNMVGALRDTDDDGVGAGAELVPQPGVVDIPRLADIAQVESPAVTVDIEVELDGNLDGLRPAVDTALYRLAQESITNAVRHARNASKVLVRIVGNEQSVRLTVHDDGVHNPPPSVSNGFGLVGMTERVSLLGGSIDAGPSGTRGWTVDAVLPRAGQPR